MKKFYIYSILLLFYLPLSATSLDTIATPSQFKKLAQVKRDLDKDGIDELVIVYDTPTETDLGTRREIHIFKQNEEKWKVWKISIGAVLPSSHGGMMGDPFDGITIERGCIVINHFGGSREKWNYTHRFRFQNNNFYLIGATINFGSPCNYFENFDYNLSTGKILGSKEIETCNINYDVVSSKKKNYSFVKKLKKPILMDNFYPGDTEVVFLSQDITFYY